MVLEAANEPICNSMLTKKEAEPEVDALDRYSRSLGVYLLKLAHSPNKQGLI